MAKPNLTQKEAIFQIIRSVLGARYQDGMDIRPLVYKENHYGRREHDSEELDLIRERIVSGLMDGSIPSEKYPLLAAESRSHYGYCNIYGEYANRIMHYWIRKDRRLNGGKKGVTAEKSRNSVADYRRRCLVDEQLINMVKLLELAQDSADIFEIKRYIASRKFFLFLRAHGIDPSSLPDDIQNDLGFVVEKLKLARTG